MLNTTRRSLQSVRVNTPDTYKNILSPLSAFFFTYFAFIASITPYFSLWLVHHGYSESQIGLMLALPPALRLIGPTSWGRLADRTGKRAKWLRLMALASALGLLLIGLAPHAGEYKVWTALVGLAVLHAMLSGQIPLTEALLLQNLGTQLHLYGRVRLYGSVGFVLALLCLGPALDYLGTQWLLVLGGFILLIHIANSWRIQDAKPLSYANLSHGFAP
jgi:MFS transporter, PPP family, 3-phenylpropionic acid transporter